MITKLKEIFGDYATVKENKFLSNNLIVTYDIKFSQKMNDLMCTASIDYPSYWKMKIKNSFPSRDIDYYHHHGKNSATMWVMRTIKEERKEKLKKIENNC